MISICSAVQVRSNERMSAFSKRTVQMFPPSKGNQDVFVRFGGKKSSAKEKELETLNTELSNAKNTIQGTYFDNIASANSQLADFYTLLKQRHELLQSMGKARPQAQTLRVKLSEDLYYDIPLKVE